MALVLADFVEETTTTTGTGTLSLAGASGTFRTFVEAIGDGNTTVYAIYASNGEYETGIGTVTNGTPDTLTRDPSPVTTTGSVLDLPVGTHRVYCTLRAEDVMVDSGLIIYESTALGEPMTCSFTEATSLA